MYLVKLVFILCGSLFLRQPPLKPVQGEEKFEVNKKQSIVRWFGRESAGNIIEGTMELQSGKLALEGRSIRTGGFVMDMNSIKCPKSEDKNGKSGIVDHLNSDDFFSVDKFPQSYFVITRAYPGTKPNELNISGKLTIKGVTNVINFPAILVKEKGQVKVQADVIFNRVQWGITYKSMNLVSMVKSGLIDSEIKLKLDLVFDELK